MGVKEFISENRAKAMENYMDFNASSKRADGDKTNTSSPKKNYMKKMTLLHIALFAAGFGAGYYFCKMKK